MVAQSSEVSTRWRCRAVVAGDHVDRGLGVAPSTMVLCADVVNSSNANGADIVQWTCTIYPNQSFKFQPIPGFPGQFWVVNQSSGKCAERTGSAGRIDQYTCSTISTQRWTLQGAFNENR